jgi:hypothetical protein
MANPVIVPCPADVWTQVAAGVKLGNVWIINKTPDYFHTYRNAGDPAPTTNAEAVKLPIPGMPIKSTITIDVYIKAVNTAGSVRVDTV